MSNFFASLKSYSFQILEVLKGKEQDYTKLPLRKAILFLSVPMVLEMVMESVFAIVDIIFVNKLGPDAIATVGITESMITIVYALAIGLSTGVGAMVARRIGEKNYNDAARAAWQAIITGLTVSLFVTALGIFFSENLLQLMGASDVIVHEMSGYTKIMLAGNACIMLLFIINAVFRSAGDPGLSMMVLWVANIINIVLDPLLIFGIGPFPELGIKGAAIATTIGRSTAVVLQVVLLVKGVGKVKLRKISLLPDWKLIVRLVKLASGSISQYLVATSSWIGLVRITAIYGSAVVAGYTVAIRIIIFVLLPAFGIANAAATLVGQNLGAGNPKRAERSALLTARVNLYFLSGVSLLFIIFPEFFVRLLTQTPEVIETAKLGLRIIGMGFFSYGFGMVIVHSLNGAGDTKTPFYINLICFWLIEIPLAYFLAEIAGWQQKGVFVSIVVAETLMTVMAYVIFKRGKWKNMKV